MTSKQRRKQRRPDVLRFDIFATIQDMSYDIFLAILDFNVVATLMYNVWI